MKRVSRTAFGGQTSQNFVRLNKNGILVVSLLLEVVLVAKIGMSRVHVERVEGLLRQSSESVKSYLRVSSDRNI